MFGIENFAAFVVAAILLNMTPGVDTVYVLTRTATEGKKVGIASAIGISSGIIFHTTLVALGLAALLAASPKAFFALKLAGAAYLVFLGIRTFRNAKDSSLLGSGKSEGKGVRKAFLQGFLTNALNPKVALFFLAFMPAFVSSSNSYGPLPFLVLGATFFATSTVWSLALVASGAVAKRFLERSDRARVGSMKGAGVIYCLLGAGVLAAGS